MTLHVLPCSSIPFHPPPSICQVYDRVQCKWLRPTPEGAASGGKPSGNKAKGGKAKGGKATGSEASGSEASSSGEASGGEYVVVLAGATLHRATAGLVPRATGEEVGATRHRVMAAEGAGGGAAAAAAGAARAGAARAGARAGSGVPRRSLVLRVRAQPSRRFSCASLMDRPGAVYRFVIGECSVGLDNSLGFDPPCAHGARCARAPSCL